MRKLKAIICKIRGHHRYNYYTSECITCGKLHHQKS